MACDALHTGQQFLSSTLANIDCQARTIGAYGYGALADPGSAISLALTVLLTIFIALFGIRLLMGPQVSGRDLIGDVLRVGIVLTLASSWPAWRVVGYDLVLNGPAEVANAIGLGSGLPGSRKDMLQRLQDADDGIVAMTAFGTGRLTGDVGAGSDIGDSPSGIALSDQFALGRGRTIFLSTIIGATALVRLGAGLLLALAPLMAGLLFFGGTASIFFGWLRALAFCALGNVMLIVSQGAELSLLYPWMSDVLQQRESRVFTPSAPTELLVLALGFAVLTAGLLFLMGRLVFFPPGLRLPPAQTTEPKERILASSRPITPWGTVGGNDVPSRAFAISEAVSEVLRREERSSAPQRLIGSPPTVQPATNAPAATASTYVVGQSDTLGTSFRRSQRRSSAATDRRDRTP